jgi:multiple sugar transport system substrate-binding protein
LSEAEKAKITRRKYLKYGGAIVAAAVVAAAGYGIYETTKPPPTTPTPTPTTPTPTLTPTKPLEGVTLNYTSMSPLSDGVDAVKGQFTAETGASVNTTVYSYEELNEKLTLNLAGHTGTIDVVTQFIEHIGRFSRYEEPLGPYVKKYGLDLSEFAEWVMKGACYYSDEYAFDPRGGGDTLYSLPVIAPAQIMAYQKEWFEDPKERSKFSDKYGYELTPPRTWKEFCDVIEFFTRPAEGIYGYGLPGGPFYWFQMWTAEMFSRNEYYVDPKTGAPRMNTPGMLEAFSLMYSYVKNGWVPPGISNYGYFEVNELFKEGKIAILYGWTIMYGALEEEGSKVRGKVGYELMPIWGEPRGKPRPPPPGVSSWVVPGSVSRQAAGGWNVAIPADSKNKDAAFQFIQFLTRKDIAKQIALKTGFVGATYSLNQDPDIQAKFPYIRTLLEGWKDEHLWIVEPRPPEFASFKERAAPVQHDVLTGKRTPKQALDECQDILAEVWKDAGYAT